MSRSRHGDTVCVFNEIEAPGLNLGVYPSPPHTPIFLFNLPSKTAPGLSGPDIQNGLSFGLAPQLARDHAANPATGQRIWNRQERA